MKLIAVTTTRERPLAFSLLCKWIQAQVRKPDLWLVCNDSPDSMLSERSGYFYLPDQLVSRPLCSGPAGPKSFAQNWLQAVEYLGTVEGEFLICPLEDDDYYHPDYLYTVEQVFLAMGADINAMTPKLFGIAQNCYYHLPTRKWRVCRNRDHSALSSTVFHSSLLPDVKRFCENIMSGHTEGPYMDAFLWMTANAQHYTRALIANYVPMQEGRAYHVGLKGFPGAAGLGNGHDPENMDYDQDAGFLKLAEWVGPEDVEEYKRIYYGVIKGNR